MSHDRPDGDTLADLVIAAAAVREGRSVRGEMCDDCC
jgi:hypothetical protein